MQNTNFLAFDLGASSGRAILGNLENNKLSLTEVHRFENQMQQIDGHYHWDIFKLFNELKWGLKKCIHETGIQPASIGIDTWGVDFAHMDKSGKIMPFPFAYRDSRTDTAIEELSQIIPKEQVYEDTGIQLMQFNSLFQLFSMVKKDPARFETTEKILFMPDALNFMFSGIAKTEFTIASTSQMIKPGKNEWQKKLIEKAGIPTGILTEIIDPGTKIGLVKEEIAKETGSQQIPVVAVAGHDTASAIASVPAKDKNYAYISSGTWSLMGIESLVPLISDKTFTMNYTNEGGVGHTTRFLKNIMGMWLIQECRRIWKSEKNYSWDEMVALAKEVKPFQCLINPDDSSFLNPTDMPRAIAHFCIKTGQKEPANHAETIRCIYDSLALKYRYTLDQIRSVTGQAIEKIHLIGGGANNHFLNQLTANATGLPVYAGPTEATAIGNILVQAKAMGLLSSLDEIREVVRNSFKVIEFKPGSSQNWENAYPLFIDLVGS